MEKQPPFSSRLFITSDNDLKNYLKPLKKAYSLVGNGDFIMNYDMILSVSRSQIKNKKVANILNTLSSKSHETEGHWVLLTVDRNNVCILVDSLSSVLCTNKEFRNTISTFCQIHKLQRMVWNVKTQSSTSQSCGFQVLYFTHFFSNNNTKNLLNLQTFFKSHTLHENEKFILKKAYALCSF